MIPLSVLDLAPVPAGEHPGQALRNTVALAQRAEALGYRRYWLAEHHNMPGIASAATAVVIGQVAAATSTLRVGSGGVMLPNHAPLMIAEQYGTLAALFPGRIELGLGRAPGTDQHTAHALRRTLTGSSDDFPRDVLELQHYFKEPEPGQQIQAVPGAGLKVPLWILGSSLFGAQLAAALGLPYAFASHFAPGAMIQAIAVYRERFEPSDQLDKPHVMLGMNVVAADTDDEAKFLRTSVMQSFVNLRRGTSGKLPPPVENYEERLMPAERMMLDESLSCSAVGSPDVVTRAMATFIEHTSADEIMMTCHIHDHQKRLRSFELVAERLRTQAKALKSA
jgi:luciferase family oxidoreductase group 1